MRRISIKIKKEGDTMINWILGGLIVGLTVFIIVRMIIRMRKGEGSCCSGCTVSKGNCHCDHTPE